MVLFGGKIRIPYLCSGFQRWKALTFRNNRKKVRVENPACIGGPVYY